MSTSQFDRSGRLQVACEFHLLPSSKTFISYSTNAPDDLAKYSEILFYTNLLARTLCIGGAERGKSAAEGWSHEGTKAGTSDYRAFPDLIAQLADSPPTTPGKRLECRLELRMVGEKPFSTFWLKCRGFGWLSMLTDLHELSFDASTALLKFLIDRRTSDVEFQASLALAGKGISDRYLRGEIGVGRSQQVGALETTANAIAAAPSFVEH